MTVIILHNWRCSIACTVWLVRQLLSLVGSRRNIPRQNMMRKTLYSDYYTESRMIPGGHTAHHTLHCIDVLRQALMCTADTSTVMFVHSLLTRQTPPSDPLP